MHSTLQNNIWLSMLLWDVVQWQIGAFSFSLALKFQPYFALPRPIHVFLFSSKITASNTSFINSFVSLRTSGCGCKTLNNRVSKAGEYQLETGHGGMYVRCLVSCFFLWQPSHSERKEKRNLTEEFRFHFFFFPINNDNPNKRLFAFISLLIDLFCRVSNLIWNALVFGDDWVTDTLT